MAQKPDFDQFDQSIMKDGTTSELSAPSMLSPVSGFSSDTSSSFFYGGGYAQAANARPAPPYSATLRTNFTSAANDNSGMGARPASALPAATEEDASESPDATFRHFRTPANDPGMPFSGMVVSASPLYGRASKRNMMFIVVAIVLGSVAGVLLKHFDVDTTASQWIMMPGSLFVRAVQCVVVPMVLVNLVVATADVVNRGLGKRLSLRMTAVLLLSIIAAIVQGLVTGVIMHSVFASYQTDESTSSTDAIFGIQCGNGKYLEAGSDGAVSCSATEIAASSQFALDDINTALVLRFTPFAVLSLLAGSLATSLDDSVADHPLRLVLHVVLTLAVSVAVHMLVVVPVAFVVFTRRNPFRFMRQMLPAYVYSLGCSSSMATMPLSLQCLETSREVPSPVMHFVLSVGTSLHMPGTAIYLAVLVHFMADVAGVEDSQSATSILVTFLGVFLCTLTAPPVPSGALTVVTAAWNIVFPEYAIPDNLYALVVASDVFLDRFVTLCNVNAQAMLCRVLADQVDDNDVAIAQVAQVQQYASR
jgi:Na+/H+-dicarboxylate symporter